MRARAAATLERRRSGPIAAIERWPDRRAATARARAAQRPAARLDAGDDGRPVRARRAGRGHRWRIDRAAALAFWAIGAEHLLRPVLGSVLLLAAIGLAITFGVMGVINMAHGEMVMLGAYTTFVVQELIRTSLARRCSTIRCSSPCRWPSWSPARSASPIERGVIRFLYGRPLETLLATWGISLILQQAVRTIFGPTNREVGNAETGCPAPSRSGGLTLTYNRHLDHRVSRCWSSPAADARPAQDRLRPADARGDAEPARWPPPWASAPAGSTR